MRIAILCLGSQGDVRPFVSLGTNLKADGHEVVIFANSPNEKLCTENDLTFFHLAGDLTSLLNYKQSEVGFGKIQIVKKILEILKAALQEQFETLYTHLKNVDGIFYHPVVFAAEHVIEAFQLPSVRVHLQPDIRSKYYASCIFPPKMPFQQWSNLASHFISAQLFWIPLRSIINKWRTERLGLKKLGLLSPLSHQPFQKIPKLIAVSQVLISKASDWPNNVHVTGYSQLAKAKVWTPPEALKQFLQAGPPPIYIGFGSLTERCNQEMSQTIVNILKHLPHRFILCGSFAYIKKEQLPDNGLWIDAAPHDWLLPKVAAVVHHGGSGTTHAALSAGKPALIIPFALDQFHWGEAIYRIGAGPKPLPVKKFTQKAFQKALEDLLSTESYRINAIEYSKKMEAEGRLKQALRVFYKHCQESEHS